MEHQAAYDRFSAKEKRVIVTLVSFTGLIPLFGSGSFIPSIPQIAKDLHSTGEVISLAVSIHVFTGGLITLLWARYSTHYGRRPIYLTALPFSIVGSMGVGRAQTVLQLMAWRVVQSTGMSGGFSLGAGVIGDLYKLEERGTAMGLFFAAVLMGPPLAPVAGGLAAHYSSWRVMQYILAVCSLFAFTLLYFLLPETSHPGARGMDKLPPNKRRNFVLLNPLKSMTLLRSPNLTAVSLAGTLTLITNYFLLVPLAYTIGKRYNINNEALIGACFIPSGIGNFIGAPLAGRISDRIIVKWKTRRGVWVPEDRLRGTLVGAFFFVPLSVLLSGLVTTYVDGVPGLVANLMLLFMNGLGVDLVLSPSASYTVDILHNRSAEGMAANSFLRGLGLSLAVTSVFPLVETLGLAWANTIAALGAWAAALLLMGTIRHGEAMRNWLDIGYTTWDENN